MDNLKILIQCNAAEISRFNKRIHETVLHRGSSARQNDQWIRACDDFHARYDRLAFLGGYFGASVRLLAGDQTGIEAALCFLEVRPYFFRSGYMYQELLRKLKRVPLTPEQEARLDQVISRQAAWKAQRATSRR